MKKTALALTLTLAFILSCSAVYVNVATANPAPLFAFPTQPLTTPPTIVMDSPSKNQVYESTEVWLNFTIFKPRDWFAIDVAYHEDFTPLTETFVNITSVYYVVDGGERQNISFHDVDSLFDTAPTLSLNCSTLIPVTAGAHTVKVGLDATSYYVVDFVDWSNPFANVTVHADSETVAFTISQSFPTVAVLVALFTALIVGCVGVLVYKKYKRLKLGLVKNP